MEQTNHGTVEVAGTVTRTETHIPMHRAECTEIYKNVRMEGIFCETTFDEFICWPPEEAGSNSTYPCPIVSSVGGHIIGYSNIPDAYATKHCKANGEWVLRTDYTRCMKYIESLYESDDLQTIVGYITFIGCIVSLVVLSLSLAIFCYFRCLQCPRLRVHRNLCTALIVHLILLLTSSIQTIFKDAATFYTINWLCKTMLALQMYSSMATINWMFVEGMLLHNKVAVNIFSYDAPFKTYYFIGWGFPILVIGTWAGLMETFHEAHCWKYFSQSYFIYIVAVPMVVALLINLVFLINILRIVISKRPLNTAVERNQIKKAVKVTAVLFPLLGTTHLLFCVVPGSAQLQTIFAIANAFVQSTQGFFVGVLYCFMNGEVQKALKQAYRRSWVAYGRDSSSSALRFLSQNSNTCVTHSDSILNVPLRKSVSTSVKLKQNTDNTKIEVIASKLPTEAMPRTNSDSSKEDSAML